MKHYVLFLIIFPVLLSGCRPSRIDFLSGTPVSESKIPDKQSAEPSKIHPFFDFTDTDFPARLNGLPSKALSEPRRFLDLVSGMLAIPEDYLLPVGHNLPLDPEYEPTELIRIKSLPDAPLTKGKQKLAAPVAEELLRLTRAASEEGIRLMILSAYRSWSYQDTVYKRHIRLYGEQEANTMSLPAGTSQHQLGTTVDFGYTKSPNGGEWRFIEEGHPAQVWLSKNAGDFGWSLSYPSSEKGSIMYEPWHWRWIGVEAVEMQDDFFGGDQEALLGFWAQNSSAFAEAFIGDALSGAD